MHTHSTSKIASRSSGNYPIRVGSRVVGKVSGCTFKKTINGSLHFLRVPPAIAFDVESLKEAEQAGAVNAEVTDRETKRVYRTTVRYIWEHGFKVNRGFGQQWALALSDWNQGKRDAPPAFRKPEQLSLWGGVE